MRPPVALAALGVIVLLLGAVVGGCQGSERDSMTATGVVTRIGSSGLDRVNGFTLRTDTGEELEFAIGPLQPGSFPPGHLTEHAATSLPIVVYYHVAADGTRVATFLVDAPPPSG